MSSAMASIATRLMSSGAAKSGKPCERLTAPYFMASRVISRITDSVNWLALRETRLDVAGTGELIKLATDEHGLAQIRIKELRSGLIIPFALIRVYLCESVVVSYSVFAMLCVFALLREISFSEPR